MMIMQTVLIGASSVDFTSDDGTRFDYIKLIVLLENKSGIGSVSQSIKYEKPASELYNEFGFLQVGKVYNVELHGEFKSNGKAADFVASKVVFKDKDNAQAK